MVVVQDELLNRLAGQIAGRYNQHFVVQSVLIPHHADILAIVCQIGSVQEVGRRVLDFVVTDQARSADVHWSVVVVVRNEKVAVLLVIIAILFLAVNVFEPLERR